VKIEPHVLIFDTGPLWELVLYRAVQTLGFEGLRPRLGLLQTDTYYSKLTDFIRQFRDRTTTPQVVAEISAKVQQTEKQGQADIWSVVYGEFRSMGMDERLLKLLEMPQELVADFGAVDASLLKLGSSYAPGTSLVLSIDGALIAECNRAGVAAKHLWEAIASE
jgi:hypothetical protein